MPLSPQLLLNDCTVILWLLRMTLNDLGPLLHFICKWRWGCILSTIWCGDKAKFLVVTDDTLPLTYQSYMLCLIFYVVTVAVAWTERLRVV